MDTKQCTLCGLDKPVDGFHWRIKSKEKRHSKCKDCFCAYMKDQRGKHVKRVRAYDNARTGTPKRLEQNRKCYANTIDVRREYERKRYPIRAEALKAQNRKRWAEESDMMRDRSRKYYASDPAKYAARAAASRAERLKRVPDWLTDCLLYTSPSPRD